MLIKMLNKNNIIRILVMLLLLIFTIASSSVYAHQSQLMTEISSSSEKINSLSSESNIHNSLPTHYDSSEDIQLELTPNDSLTKEHTLHQEATAPLVQSLNIMPASIDTLYQGSAYDSFFENTVFVGDSISVGFANYCQYNSDSLASNSTYFLAKESCGAFIVTSELALTKYANKMPSYQGQIQYIEDSIFQMEHLEKVFICYGINDLVGSSPEEYIIDMTILIDRILNKSPNLSIYIISIPCITENATSGYLSNDSIQAANQLLETTCTEQGWGFVNLTEYLMNENLAIRPEYSSDNYVHQNNYAYQVWTKVLRNYAYMHTKE